MVAMARNATRPRWQRLAGAVAAAAPLAVGTIACGSTSGGAVVATTPSTVVDPRPAGYPAEDADRFFAALDSLPMAIDMANPFSGEVPGATVTEAMVGGPAVLEGAGHPVTREVEGMSGERRLRIPLVATEEGPVALVVDLGSVPPEGSSFESLAALAPPEGTGVAVITSSETGDVVSLFAGYLLVIRADDGTARFRSGWLGLLPDGAAPMSGDDYETLVGRMRAATAPS